MIFRIVISALAIFAASCQVKGSDGNSNIDDNSVLGSKVSDDVARRLLRESISAGNIFDNEEKNNAIVAKSRQNGLFFKTLLYDILQEVELVPKITAKNLDERIQNISFFLDIDLNRNDEFSTILARSIEKAANLGAPIPQISGIINAFTRSVNLPNDFTVSDEINKLSDSIIEKLTNNPIRVVRMMFHFLSLIPVNLNDLDTLIESIQTSFNLPNFEGELTRSMLNTLKIKISRGDFIPIEEQSLRTLPQISSPFDVIVNKVFEDQNANAELAAILSRNDSIFIHILFQALYSSDAIAPGAFDLDGAIASGTALKEISSFFEGPNTTEERAEANLRRWMRRAFDLGTSVNKINNIIKNTTGDKSIYLIRQSNDEIGEVVDKIWENHRDKFLRVALAILVSGKIDIDNIDYFIGEINDNYFNAQNIYIDNIKRVIDAAKDEVNQVG